VIEERLAPPKRIVEIEVDGEVVRAPEGSTLLDAMRRAGKDQPTLCYLENLTPVNTCRVCVVEVEGSRTLVPACSREINAGMVVSTESERVATSRKLVFEFLGSSVDLSLLDEATGGWMEHYEVDTDRYPEPETVAQPVKIEDDLYIRDYAKCILCYKCVEACGEDAQNTFAIQVAGRGFEATISTEFDAVLPESACVYCGNCIGVCPTGALMFKSEFDMRSAGTWDESAQTMTQTICPYCGVGCTLELHVQDNEIVKVTSPLDHSVTSGHLCIKGRFGFQHVQSRD
jgi:predicted molibdopterin-dependent oxidoreductase YjgC